MTARDCSEAMAAMPASSGYVSMDVRVDIAVAEEFEHGIPASFAQRRIASPDFTGANANDCEICLMRM